MDIMKNQIPLPDITWSVQDINKFIQHSLIHLQYNSREIKYIDHNYSSDASSLWVDPLVVGGVGHTAGLTNPRPWRGRCRAGCSNTGGPPLPSKEGAINKKTLFNIPSGLLLPRVASLSNLLLCFIGLLLFVIPSKLFFKLLTALHPV